jgi:hypothetical protein
MLAVSFSRNYVRYGQLVQVNGQRSLETIQKVALPFVFEPNALNSRQLEPVFQNICSKLPVPERNLALSLDSEWFDCSINSVEEGLDTSEIQTILDNYEQLRLGDWFSSKFIQHYSLKSSNQDRRDYLTVSYYKELGKVLHQAIQAAGLAIKVFDINLFSAVQTLNRLHPDLKAKRWGVWQVTPERQELLLIENDEVYQHITFKFIDAEHYQIDRFANPDQRGLEIITEINRLRTYQSDTITLLDQLFFYSYDVTEEFFNILLTFELDNFTCYDPLTKFKPVELYLGDGDGVGAMCQFTDVLGLLLRFMPEEQP